MAGHVFVLPVVQCIVTDVGDGMVVFSTHTQNKNKQSTLYVVRKNIGRKIYNVDPKYIMWTQKIQLAIHQFCTSVTVRILLTPASTETATETPGTATDSGTPPAALATPP